MRSKIPEGPTLVIDPPCKLHDFAWGIELLVQGVGIGEHMDRFTLAIGKYASLDVGDYAVVDFRRNTTGKPTSISRHAKRITVFFKDADYSIAQCIFGVDGDPVEVRLST